MLAALVLLQVVFGPPVPKDLRKPVARAAIPCPDADASGDVVVCGRPTDQRLEPLPEQVQKAPEDMMTFRLPGGGSGNVHAIQTTLSGAVGQGMAVTLKIPLGKKRKPAGD